MIDITTVKVGNIIETKKPHPCKSNKWKVLRIGVDFKLECLGCGHVIMIERKDLVKRIKQVISNE